jgi:hypothetical protein
VGHDRRTLQRLALYCPSLVSRMNKTQALAEFRECVGNCYDRDRIAKREAWHNFIDTLCRDQLVTERQRATWTCPF